MLLRQPRISIKKRNMLLKCFVEHLTAVQAAKFSTVNRSTANLYYNHLRQIIFERYALAPRFSGEVEIDECLFGKGIKRRKFDARAYGAPYDDTYKMLRKGKKILKKKKNNILVFGIQRRGGDVYTHIIEKRDRLTLLPIIHLVVAAGATVVSDMNKAYDILKEDGYKHQQVNHSEGFINKKGYHIGTIESFWSSARDHFSRFRGIARRTFPLHLKECEFRWNNRGDKKSITAILKQWAF